MRHLIRVLFGALLALTFAGGLLATTATPAAAAAVEKPLYRMIRDLPVAQEVRTGYDRDKFNLWVDADGDCFDTRAEVLIAESKTSTTHNSYCTITSGKWYSWYDGATFTDPSSVDIDHMVPLAEAWDSGARKWTAGTRQRYANDLGDGRALAAVSASSNRSKGDQDPREWMPAKNKCQYLRHWVAVKVRWRLTVNWNEKVAIRDFAHAHCANTNLRVTRATVVYQ